MKSLNTNNLPAVVEDEPEHIRDQLIVERIAKLLPDVESKKVMGLRVVHK